MKINAIKSACNGGKRSTIYRYIDRRSVQWISNGFAAYRVRGIEIESAAALMELWGLSEKTRNKAVILEEITSDPRFRPVVEYEEELELLGTVGLNEEGQYVGLKSDAGVLWIDIEWLKPVKMDYGRYYARWYDGKALVAVYEDLTDAEALITPVADMIASTLCASARRMSERPFRTRDTDADAEEQAEALIRSLEGRGAEDDTDDADGDA